jgi:hypothetical protein
MDAAGADAAERLLSLADELAAAHGPGARLTRRVSA